MEHIAELLATGDPGLLVLAVVAFAAAMLLGALAIRIRPRRRTARRSG